MTFIGRVLFFFFRESAPTSQRGPRDKLLNVVTHRSFLFLLRARVFSNVLWCDVNSRGFVLLVRLIFRSSWNPRARFVTIYRQEFSFCSFYVQRNPCHEDEYASQIYIYCELKSSNAFFHARIIRFVYRIIKGIRETNGELRESINFKYTLFRWFRSTNDF